VPIFNKAPEEDNAFNKSWSGNNCYGKCPYNNDDIYKMLNKAMTTFMDDRDLNTKFTFVLPEWKTMPWYKTFICHFDVIKRIEKLTPGVFNQPISDDKTPIPGEEHRTLSGPLPWPVIIIHKDRFTKSNVTDIMLLHLQLGHANIKKLAKAQAKYGTNSQSRTNTTSVPYCRPITSSDKTYCGACNVAKAKKFALARKPAREATQATILNAELETNKQEKATKFGNLVYCDYKYISVDGMNNEKFVLILIDWTTRMVHTYNTTSRSAAP